MVVDIPLIAVEAGDVVVETELDVFMAVIEDVALILLIPPPILLILLIALIWQLFKDAAAALAAAAAVCNDNVLVW